MEWQTFEIADKDTLKRVCPHWVTCWTRIRLDSRLRFEKRDFENALIPCTAMAVWMDQSVKRVMTLENDAYKVSFSNVMGDMRIDWITNKEPYGQYSFDGDGYLTGVWEPDGTLWEKSDAKERKKADARARLVAKKRKTLSDAHTRVAKSSVPAVSEVPTCVICYEEMHHGDETFIYVSCGHRVLCGACRKTLDARWEAQCPKCKVKGTIMRVYH